MRTDEERPLAPAPSATSLLYWATILAACSIGETVADLVSHDLGLGYVRASAIFVGAFAVLAMALLAVALSAGPRVAPWAFALTGFSLSVMWSVIFSLALNSVAEHHGAFSGILCTAIVGGAVLPWIIGALGDRLGLRPAMLVLYATLAYILSISRWARPLVDNARAEAA